MTKLISKELKELRTKDEHLKENLNTESNSLIYQEKLIELSKRTASGFSVERQLPIIILKFGKFNWLFATLFFIFISYFIFGAIKNINDPLFILIPCVILALAIIYGKYFSVTNTITIDCIQRILIVENNHWIGKYLGGKIKISFSEIISFEKKLKTFRHNGMTYKRHRIILKTNLKSIQLFEIPYGPIYYVNENLMIQSIMGIINNTPTK